MGYATALKSKLTYNELCNLVSQGKSDKEIGEMYGVHSCTIQRNRREWGISKPQNPDKYDWGIVQRMLESNLTYDDIAYIYQSTPKAIINYVSRKKKEEQAYA